MMNENDYYYNKGTLDRVYGDQQHEAAMSLLTEQRDYNLVAILKPRITKDGNQWCCLYGEDLQVGVAGFGDTPHLAVLDFNKAFHKN